MSSLLQAPSIIFTTRVASAPTKMRLASASPRHVSVGAAASPQPPTPPSSSSVFVLLFQILIYIIRMVMGLGEGRKKGVCIYMVSDSSAVEWSFSSSNNSSTHITSSPSSMMDVSNDASSPSPVSRGNTVEEGDETSLRNRFPIRRGLSRFYDGKSQSYQSLSDVRNVEDLPKKVMPLGGKMKQSRSYAGGLNGCSTSGSSFEQIRSTRISSGDVLGRCKLPPIPAAHKNIF